MYGFWSTEIVGDFEPEEFFGMVYLIENLVTGRKYVGKKQFRCFRRKIVKGRKNRKVHITESDWRIYTGSCVELNEDIVRLGKDKFKFDILKLCKTKREWSFFEVEEQFRRKVLDALLEDGTREYYNANIMSRWFVAKDPHKPKSEETKKKMSEAFRVSWSKGRDTSKMGRYERTPETLQKLAMAKLGTKRGPHTLESRLKMSENHRSKRGYIPPFSGLKHSEETRLKISQSGKGKHNHHGANNPNYKGR